MVDGDLYQRGTDEVFLRCISREEGSELLADIHEAECGSHSSSRMLVEKAFRHGFYWLAALQDAAKLVRLPVPREADTPTSTGTPYHTPVKAVCGLGARCLGTFPKSHRGF